MAIDTAELRRLVEKATPRLWGVLGDRHNTITDDDDFVIAKVQNRDNANAICALRNHAKAIADELDALRADLREYRNLAGEQGDIIKSDKQIFADLMAANDALREQNDWFAMRVNWYSKELDALTAERDRLREALQPFQFYGIEDSGNDWIDDDQMPDDPIEAFEYCLAKADDRDTFTIDVTVGDIRKARQALGEQPKSMSQKMADAGFTRRPSGKAIGDDE